VSLLLGLTGTVAVAFAFELDLEEYSLAQWREWYADRLARPVKLHDRRLYSGLAALGLAQLLSAIS